MIFRQKSINSSKTEVSLQVSFTTADVKRFLFAYIDCLANPLGRGWAQEQPVTEAGLTKWLTETELKFFAEPHRSQLCKWVWVQATKNGFLLPSANDRFVFYFSDDMTKRIGRPKKDVF